MTANEQLINSFYKAFQNKDYKTMQQCYADDVVFNDEVFKNLNALQVRAMWEMLCKNAKDFSLQFSKVEADNEYGTCNWVAHYTFSQTGNKVTNNIKAYFKFHEGKIVEHTDSFDLWKWSRQALGLPGWLLGWNMALQKKIQQKAQNNLAKFMQSKSN